MKEYGNLKLYTTIDEIRSMQTIKPPTSDQIRISDACYGYTSGCATAIYDSKHDSFWINYHETEEEAVEYIGKNYDMHKKFPEVFGTILDAYIFKSSGYTKPDWWLHSIAKVQ